MTPVDVMIPGEDSLPVLLENLVREEENDNDEGDDQKRAQYYVLDHDYLLAVKRLQLHCSWNATVCTPDDYLFRNKRDPPYASA